MDSNSDDITINEITINEITQVHIEIYESSIKSSIKSKSISSIKSQVSSQVQQVKAWIEYIPVFVGLILYTVIVLIYYIFKETPPTIVIWSSFSDLQEIKIWSWIVLITSTLLIFIIIHIVLKKKIVIYFYLLILMLVFTSNIVGNNVYLRSNGFGASIWCIIFGAIFRMLYKKTNEKIKSVMSLEFFIKVAIVLLAINLSEIVIVGWKGLIVAWVETVLLLLFVYQIGVKILKMDSIEALIVAVGLSICGSSAIVSIQNSIKVESDIIYKMICLMSIFSIPFIPLLPYIGKLNNFGDTLTGIWIGGSIDSTGAVAASGVLGGINILHIAIILKMLQNIIIAPITLVVTILWTKEYNFYLLWNKFPKFVLGFLLVALITTFLPSNLQTNVVNNTFIISEWFSSVSFVLIGMEIDLLNLKKQFKDKHKMIILYTFGQILDTFTTLGTAFILYKLI